jgi:hypothetical protein
VFPAAGFAIDNATRMRDDCAKAAQGFRGFDHLPSGCDDILDNDYPPILNRRTLR